ARPRSFWRRPADRLRGGGEVRPPLAPARDDGDGRGEWRAGGASGGASGEDGGARAEGPSGERAAGAAGRPAGGGIRSAGVESGRGGADPGPDPSADRRVGASRK